MSIYPPAQEGSDSADADSAVSARRGAKAVVSSSSRVLLVKERHSDGGVFWTLPGGGVRPHEPLVVGLRRELIEELRCRPIVDDVVSEFWYSHRSSSDTVSRYVVFSCAVLSPVRPVRSEGILDHRWIDPERPPARTLPQVRQLLRDLDLDLDLDP